MDSVCKADELIDSSAQNPQLLRRYQQRSETIGTDIQLAVLSFANKVYEHIGCHGENFGDSVVVGRVPPRARIGVVHLVTVHESEIRGMSISFCMPKSREFSDEPIASLGFSVNPTFSCGISVDVAVSPRRTQFLARLQLIYSIIQREVLVGRKCEVDAKNV